VRFSKPWQELSCFQLLDLHFDSVISPKSLTLKIFLKFTKHLEVPRTPAGAAWWVENTFPMPGFQHGNGGVHTPEIITCNYEV
jgi:hypothetical protein